MCLRFVPLRKRAGQIEHERRKKICKENGSRFAQRFTLYSTWSSSETGSFVFVVVQTNGVRAVFLSSLHLPSDTSDR